MSKDAIVVHNLHKEFLLPHQKITTLKEAIIHPFSRRTKERQKVLDGINFEVKKGEFFGIVGKNGSGKSTLLKILAEIYTPTRGDIHVNGKLTPFIELGVGFNPELSGKDNLFLNGALLGFSRKKVEEMYDEIVNFAELEPFMDQKLKNYSSGMQVRLAFSIAIRAESDILLIDEVLAVGDYSFQQKCYEYFRYLGALKKTVVFVSHDTNALQAYCTKGILIDEGKIMEWGTMPAVLAKYNKVNTRLIDTDKSGGAVTITSDVEDYGYIEMRRIYTSGSNKQTKQIFAPNDEILVSFEILPKKDLDNPVIGLVLQDAGGRAIMATNTLDAGHKTGKLSANKTVTLTFKIKNVFNDGRLYVSGAIASSDRKELYYRFRGACSFNSIGWTTTAKGIVYLPYKFEIKNK